MKQGQCTKCGTFKSVGAMQGKYCINCATWARGHKAMLQGNKDITITKKVPQRTYIMGLMNGTPVMFVD